MSDAGNFDPFTEVVDAVSDHSLVAKIRQRYAAGHISVFELISETIRLSLALRSLQVAKDRGLNLPKIKADLLSGAMKHDEAVAEIRNILEDQ